MKTILLLVSAAAVTFAADLGVISPRTAIQLSHETTRQDFASFIVELLPAGHTNPPIKLILTNDLLRVEDVPQLMSGRVTMGLRSSFKDGAQSKVRLYTFDLRRGDPPEPSAIPIGVPAPVHDSEGLTNELRKIREASGAQALPQTPWSSRVTSTNFSNGIVIHGISEDVVLFDEKRTPTEDRWVTIGDTIRQLEAMTGSNVVFTPNPLPRAKNQTYAEYLDWLADRKGKRRNE